MLAKVLGHLRDRGPVLLFPPAGVVLAVLNYALFWKPSDEEWKRIAFMRECTQAHSADDCNAVFVGKQMGLR